MIAAWPVPARRVSDLPWPVWAFAISLLVPAEMWIELAGARIDAQRAVLIATAPGVVWWTFGAGLRHFDWLVIAGALWGLLACLQTLPAMAGLERGGAFMLEVVVAFLLPASLLTSVARIRATLRLLVPVLGILALLSAIEAILRSHFIAESAAALFDRDAPFRADVRLGLLRARTTFSHQILFGLFCAALFAPLWYEARSGTERAGRTLACFAGTYFSLSSAAWVLFVLQLVLIGIERATRGLAHRLSLSILATAAGLAGISVAVTGGVAGFATRYLALNPDTAYYRQLIWAHATDDIAAHPLWGTAGAWTRLPWMVESIDQTYFAKSLQFGVPSIALIVLAGGAIAVSLLGRPLGGAHRALATGWALAVLSLAIAGLVVDYFGRSLPFAMFMLGLGAALARIRAP